jgi:hypothetical protein
MASSTRGEAAKGKQSAIDMECVADAGSLEPSSNDDKMLGEWWSVREMRNIDNKCDSPCVINQNSVTNPG